MKTTELARYVLQPTAISRAIYSVSPYARKLMAMAMSYLSLDKGNYEVTFSAREFMDTLGIENGGEQKQLIKAAVEECLGSTIGIILDNGDWTGYTWFTKSHLSNLKFEWGWGWDTITMKFNPELGEVIKTLKKMYDKINLIDLGKLQSRYAIRFYELALSYKSFAGQDGNPAGEWYFDKSLPELRMLFEIEKRKYQRTGNFRHDVIEVPLDELNEANIGVHITPEYLRRGKFLVGVRFHCKYTERNNNAEIPFIPDSTRKAQSLRKKHPEEWLKLYEAEKQNALLKSLPWETLTPDQDRMIAGIADEKLAEQMKNKPKGKRTATPKT
jgi:hypothetical protein